MEERRERWLEYHDRATAGIPGLLPLVLDMPVRFTEAVDPKSRRMGVFKHARGVLRGRELLEEEAARVAACDAPEIVLRQQPAELKIEILNPTKELERTRGKAIFVLKLQIRPWTLDKEGKVKLRRIGFPIVPDFGGTAHAYCGTTMETTLGDLLSWHMKPCLEDMLKAYIIKSRIRKAENLMISQPYSPHLFRQGLLPGPSRPP